MKRIPFVVSGMAVLLIASLVYAGDPMISPIANQWLKPGQSTGNIPFTVIDDTTAPDNITITAQSTNETLVPNSPSNIIILGTGKNRTVKVIPLANQASSATIVLTAVDDDNDQGQESFEVTVTKTQTP